VTCENDDTGTQEVGATVKTCKEKDESIGTATGNINSGWKRGRFAIVESTVYGR
jgi:hypothetical protein